MSKKMEKISLSKGLRFRIGEDGKMYVSISPSSGEFTIAPEVIAILCQIAASSHKLDLKKYYENILDNIPDEEECEDILEDLVASGVVIHSQKKVNRYLQADGFGDFWIQWAMLADSKRSLSYEKAILKCLDKNSTVVDVGAGSGLLTAACLKAGAKKVIAIEETQIAQKIIPLLNACKLPTQKDKLSVLNLNSFDVQLPKEVTHIVSELFGNDPFSEGIIPTLRNIGKNFKKQPVYIPLKVAVYFELIDIVEHPVRHRIIAAQSTSVTHDFLSAARKMFALKNISFPVSLGKNNFKRVAKPIELGQLPLNPPPISLSALCGKKKIKVTGEGKCIVGLMWFRVYLTELITISSHPQEQDAAEHWSPIVVLINKPVYKNEELVFEHSLNELETQIQCNFL